VCSSDLVQIASSGKLQELAMKREILMLEYAQKHDMQLQQIKADLAVAAMDAQLRRELAATAHAESAAEARNTRTHALNVESLRLAQERDLAAAPAPVEP
jgi:hypothetical protein